MRNGPRLRKRRFSGSVLLLLLVFLSVMATFLVGALSKANRQIERDQITAAALAQAKEALIGFATSVVLTPAGTRRPGDLPCPDNHPLGDVLEGTPSTPCNGNALGRLPWKTLDLPDLRDGSGERLWYAVSIKFKNSTRTSCTAPGQVGCLNSETTGTLTVRDPSGAIVNNGTDSTAAIAVIIAPGSILTRQDSVNQVRDAAGYNTPTNYLDIANGEDNADFINSDPNGFIRGDVRDAAQMVVLNDRLITIALGELIPLIEKRVAGEALSCLTEYAADPQNQGRYPWAAPLNPLAAPNYADAAASRFGRIADTGVGRANTVASSGALNPMLNIWPGNCNIGSNTGWWRNWKDMVFYAVADAYKPVNLDVPPVPAPGCGVTGTCLAVNPPAAAADKRVAVFVAGRQLTAVAGGQPRASDADKGTIANYLENQNATPVDDVFERNVITSTFNDATSFKGPP